MESDTCEVVIDNGEIIELEEVHDDQDTQIVYIIDDSAVQESSILDDEQEFEIEEETQQLVEVDGEQFVFVSEFKYQNILKEMKRPRKSKGGQKLISKKSKALPKKNRLRSLPGLCQLSIAGGSRGGGGENRTANVLTSKQLHWSTESEMQAVRENIESLVVKSRKEVQLFSRDQLVQACPEVGSEEVVISGTEPADMEPGALPLVVRRSLAPQAVVNNSGFKVIQPKVDEPKLIISETVDLNSGKCSTGKILITFPSPPAHQRPGPRLSAMKESTMPEVTSHSELPRIIKTCIAGKHRWLWQFMKELFDRKDSCLEWVDSKSGVFKLRDQERLGTLWECYKKLKNIKAQSWRQMRYYFGWYEENRIIKQVCLENFTFRFQEQFLVERFLPYGYVPLRDFSELERLTLEVEYNRMRPGLLQEKLYCVRGCGSQFKREEACRRHEQVCSHHPELEEEQEEAVGLHVNE